jgi:Cof subfamily protein (haloacid dehalogenase superfamily)
MSQVSRAGARYKLLVVDVDGTLIGSSGAPSPRIRQAVAAAQSAGVKVALCTGRPLASCWPIVRDLDLRGAHIVFNGALVKDPAVASAVLFRPLPKGPARQVVDYCRANDLCLELYTDETHYVERDWEESRLHATSIRVTYRFSDFDDLLATHELVKAQIITRSEEARRATQQLAADLAGTLGLSVAIPMYPCVGCECVNVVDPEVSKGRAVRALIEHHGLQPSQVVAAGDAPNDLPVFAEVGYRVAMANADQVVKDEADYVAPDVEDDGLATAIETLLL